MDWSSVFEDEGEEDGNWVREEISSRTRIFSLFGKDGYTPLVCYAFTVNYILGVGCLGIPYAFLQSGVVLGSILVVALSYVSYVTVLWVAGATQQELTIAAYHLTKSTNPFIMSPFSSQLRRNHRIRNNKSTNTHRENGSSSNILMKSIKSVLSSSAMESLGLLSSTATTPTVGSSTASLSTAGGKLNHTYNNYSSLFSVEESSGYHHSLQEEVHFASLPSSTRLTSQHYPQTSHHHAKTTGKTSWSSTTHSRVASTDNLSLANSSSQQVSQQQQQQQLDRMAVQELEVTDLAEEFLGPSGKVLYQMALMALTYVGLLAYTQVFNDTFRLQVWPEVPSWLPPFLFGLTVVPLSCMDLQEQIAAQVAMSILRFVSLGILLFGTLVALYMDYDHSAIAMAAQQSTTATDSMSAAIPWIRWDGFGVMFTTAIFSQLFQHSVPGLIRPLSKENKKYIPQIFRAALTTTALLYICTGSVCVAYFGDRLSQSVNLNFVGFTWGMNKDAAGELGYLGVKMLAMVVVLFPALDTLSVFPLIAITLGNNLHAACPQVTQYLFPGNASTATAAAATSSSATTTQKQQQQQHDAKRQAILFWRLVAAIPPILCSLGVRHLVISLQIAGLCGILVALVFPALLHRHAQVRSAMLPLSWMTSASSSWTSSSSLSCDQWWSWSYWSSCSWCSCCWTLNNPNPNGAQRLKQQQLQQQQEDTVPGIVRGDDGAQQQQQQQQQYEEQHDPTMVVNTVLAIAAIALGISLYQMVFI